jgi:hypothetical protein
MRIGSARIGISIAKGADESNEVTETVPAAIRPQEQQQQGELVPVPSSTDQPLTQAIGAVVMSFETQNNDAPSVIF